MQVAAPPEKPKDDDDDKKDASRRQSAAKPKTSRVRSPPAAIIVRMDQPYSRIADALLDRQYWAPDDPQKHPYDDTGWSFGDLFGTEVVRVTDTRC